MADWGCDVGLRSLERTDCEWVAALIRVAFATLRVDPAPSALAVSAEMIGAHLAAGGGGVVIGPDRACVMWVSQAGGLYVSRLAVHPAARGRGLAAALLEEAEAEACRVGLPRVWLSTRLAAGGNRRLFARCGFVEGERRAHAGYAEPTYVEMEKRLLPGLRRHPHPDPLPPAGEGDVGL